MVTHPFKKVKSYRECKSYRGFRLHNIVYKIYASILNKPKQLSRKKSKKKNGFKSGHSTVENIFILQRFLNKIREFNP